MAPDDLIKPRHLGIDIEQLTPKRRPTALTDRLDSHIRSCAATGPKHDVGEIMECLNEGPCSRKGQRKVSLGMVLYALAAHKKSRRRATRRD